MPRISAKEMGRAGRWLRSLHRLQAVGKGANEA